MSASSLQKQWCLTGINTEPSECVPLRQRFHTLHDPCWLAKEISCHQLPLRACLGFSPNLWLLGMLLGKRLSSPTAGDCTLDLKCHKLTLTGTGAVFCPRVLNCLFPDSTCFSLSSLSLSLSPSFLPSVANNLVPLHTESR